MEFRKIFSFCLLGALAANAQAANEQHREIEASPTGSVTISNVAGSIEVSGWSRNLVEVDADLGWDVEELIVERDGDDVLVKVKVPRNSGRSDISSELVLRVPERSSLDVAGVSADIEVRGVFGEQRLHAVSGDVVTQAFESDISIEVVSGDVEVLGDRKAMHSKITSVSGDIDAAALHGDIESSTVSGDLTIADGRFERADVHTVNGDLVFRGAMVDGGRLDVETVNGSVNVQFDGEIEARYDIETFNGSIRNCFGPEAQRTSRYTPGRELKFSEGSANTRVTIRTLNGGVRVCKD